MKYSFILLAAGIGKRMQREIPKHFLPLGGKPIIMHTLERVDTIDEIDEVIVVINANRTDEMRELVENRRLEKKYRIIKGGSTRQESVMIGLENACCDNVIIHEAARPFVKRDDFLRLLSSHSENAIYGCPLSFTVLLGSEKVEGVLKRDELINVQLPHKYNRSLLLAAHRKASQEQQFFTEDAGLLYYYSHVDIDVLKGSTYNIKITNPVDLIVGEQIYKDYILVSEV